VVKKEYRNNGIGTALLKETEHWALNNLYHYLWLFTESNKNIDFYKHKGFTYVGVHKGAYFGANEHMLSKQLRNEPFPEVFTNYSKYF
jgi:ribosomal protein S18 acetylase RimI-like enzyme